MLILSYVEGEASVGYMRSCLKRRAWEIAQWLKPLAVVITEDPHIHMALTTICSSSYKGFNSVS